MLVKYDETYPYGDAQDRFKEVVQDSLSQNKLLMAEVHVAGVLNVCSTIAVYADFLICLTSLLYTSIYISIYLPTYLSMFLSI